MRLRIKFKKYFIFMLAAVIALGVAATVINSLVLAEAGGFVNYGDATAVSATVASTALIFFGVAALCGSFYSFRANCLTVRFALFGDKILYADMTAVRVTEKNNEMFLIYKRAKKGVVKEEALLLILNPDEYDSVWKKLSSANPEITYEIISEK
ncbi:MAG: hypothetical protein LBC13_02160 [Clostridiales bacterium]|nr:hypothetical protein [Clostridiales bacterium]